VFDPIIVAQRTTAIAPVMSKRRIFRCPIFDIRPRMALPPVECWRGVSPNHAAKSRPLGKLSIGAEKAATAAAQIGPTPGIGIRRAETSSFAVSPNYTVFGLRADCEIKELINGFAQFGGDTINGLNGMDTRSVIPVSRMLNDCRFCFLARNTKTVPVNVSLRNPFLTIAARLSWPLRKSIGLVATMNPHPVRGG